jgi:hypothetical protein
MMNRRAANGCRFSCSEPDPVVLVAPVPPLPVLPVPPEPVLLVPPEPVLAVPLEPELPPNECVCSPAASIPLSVVTLSTPLVVIPAAMDPPEADRAWLCSDVLVYRDFTMLWLWEPS